MLKRKNIVMILILFVMTMLFCRTEIYAKTSVDVTNHFETGIVDIGIKEYREVSGKEELWEDNLTVLPGDRVSKIPRIYNYGTDCYVRVKIHFREAGELTENNLFGMSDQWMKADDGWYYYKQILKEGKTADVFNGFEIQKNLSEKMAEKTFYIDIDAEAIQSKNFTPNFESASPWGSVEILSCEKEGQYDIGVLKKSDTQAFKIEYQGKTEKLIKNKDDFFVNFPYLMPGDKYSDFIKLVNDNKTKDMKIYFRSEAKDDSELLDKIVLRITTELNGEKRAVYEGSLRAVELSKEGLLGVIPRSKEGTFYFEIEVPSTLNNQYTILDSHVKWIFSTEPVRETKPLIGESVKTGDTAMVGIYAVLLLFSSCVLIMRKRRKKFMQIWCVCFLLLSSFWITGRVFAYLADGDKAVNMMVIGGNRVELIERFEPPAELVPGVTFTKDVKVKNVGQNDCYVRIKAVFTDSDMGDYCTLDFNMQEYEYSEEDGYYYYKKVLKKDEETTSLFTTVSLSRSIPKEQIKDFDILVYTETYQSHGFDDYKHAWAHYHRNRPE